MQGGGQADAMAGADVEGPDVRAAAQDGADDFLFVHEGLPLSLFVAEWGGGAPRQAGLGDADAGAVRQQADVAGDAKAARVGQSLPVKEQQVGRGLELAERLQDGRPFPEAEQAGHVGEGRRPTRDDFFYQLQPWKGEHDHGGASDGVALLEANVHAGDKPHFVQPVLDDQRRPQPLLDSHRLRRRHVPGMCVSRIKFHGLLALSRKPLADG